MSTNNAPSLQLVGTFVRQANLTSSILPLEAPKGEIEYNINMKASHRKLEGTNQTAVSLLLELDGKIAGMDEPVIKGLFEVEMVASIENMPKVSMEEAIEVFIPNQVMPFMRELVFSTSARAGFNAVTIPPIVFGLNPGSKAPAAPAKAPNYAAGPKLVPAPKAIH